MLKRATVVRSRAGRDSGRLLAVLQAEGSVVWLCDGRERPLHRPKRKNIRHITPTEFALRAEDLRSDRALRRALRRLEAEYEGNQH